MVAVANHTIDQNSEQKFKAVAIRRLVSKLDRRLIPFLFVLEMSSYINRNSIGMYFWIKWLLIIEDYTIIGHAKLMGIEADLHMSRSESDLAISIFFVAYVRKYIGELWDILTHFFCFSWSLEFPVISFYVLLVRRVICRWVRLHGAALLSVWLL